MEGKASDLPPSLPWKICLIQGLLAGARPRALLFCLVSCPYVCHKEVSVHERGAPFPDTSAIYLLLWKQTKANQGTKVVAKEAKSF